MGELFSTIFDNKDKNKYVLKCNVCGFEQEMSYNFGNDIRNAHTRTFFRNHADFCEKREEKYSYIKTY